VGDTLGRYYQEEGKGHHVYSASAKCFRVVSTYSQIRTEKQHTSAVTRDRSSVASDTDPFSFPRLCTKTKSEFNIPNMIVQSACPVKSQALTSDVCW